MSITRNNFDLVLQLKTEYHTNLKQEGQTMCDAIKWQELVPFLNKYQNRMKSLTIPAHASIIL